MGKKSQLRREKRDRIEKERKEIVRRLEVANNPWEAFWKRVDFWVYTVCFALIIAFPFIKHDSLVIGDQAILHTTKGDIEIEFYGKDAPKAVENFQLLAQKGYYNGLTFHRVIKSFMIQGGDPIGDGTGGESAWGEPFKDEINPKALGLLDSAISKLVEQGYNYDYSLNSHKVLKGSIAMANSGPDTNGSQFFIITEKDQPHLDGQHTVFGHVTKGLEVAKAISEAEVDENDKPKEPIYINSVELK